MAVSNLVGKCSEEHTVLFIDSCCVTGLVRKVLSTFHGRDGSSQVPFGTALLLLLVSCVIIRYRK